MGAKVLERCHHCLGRDPARRDRLGHGGRRRAEECFDVRRMVAQYEALYRAGTRRTGSSDAGMRE